MTIRRVLLVAATVVCALVGAITMVQAEPADAFVKQVYRASKSAP